MSDLLTNSFKLLNGKDLIGNEKYDISMASHNQNSIIPPKNIEKYTILLRAVSMFSVTPNMSRDLKRTANESPIPGVLIG